MVSRAERFRRVELIINELKERGHVIENKDGKIILTPAGHAWNDQRKAAERDNK